MAKKRDWQLSDKQENIFKNLWSQVAKHFDFRTHNQGYRGTERYREGLRAFCKHLAIEYQSKNFRNISDKHLQSFIQASKADGMSPKSIKTELSAIRKLHTKIPDTRYQLSENKDLGYTDRRKNRGVDRAWQDTEVQRAVDLANNMDRKDVAWSIQIARNLGLRIEETTALTRTQLRDALSRNELSLRTTKGGIPRDIPMNERSRQIFQEILRETDQSGKDRIFTGHGKTHHEAFKSIQNWIWNHRETFQEDHKKDSTYLQILNIDEERPNLTFHGLRHAFARQQYEQRIANRVSELEARTEVSNLLGHGRDDVTRIYLAK
ncbi:tyrosine-type recombinase/integrase [Brevibacillus brevis]|uniref:tyrosine-type recombinase/integrase n=1 Tax=Brevibacillus brevis TaxID=1393 RepID=UPI0025A64C6D|nr:tyrosine-type recombinase/integrase [Brevibacillus brevis]WJQ79819.1 integrase domain-containing protein [Brevibacillus brevis]